MNDWRPWSPWVYLLRDFGFPVVVAGYVLIRLDATLRDLLREVHALALEVAKLGARLAALPLQ